MKLPSPKQLLVTVIVPVYQGERYIAQAIQSISGQTYRELEIIVVDDGSTDGTKGLLAQCAARDSRVKLLLLKQNVGVHRARVAGANSASGDLIGFLDADDIMAPEAMETMVSRLLETGSDIVIAGVRFLSENAEPGGDKVVFPHPEVLDLDILKRFSALDLGSGMLFNKLYQRSVLLPHLLRDFQEKVETNEDYLVNFGAFADAERVCTVASPLLFYRRYQGSLTTRQTTAAGFSQLLRAYALCRETYGDRGENTSECIDLLYAKLISFDSARLSDPARDLRGLEDHISESIGRLTRANVASAYEMIKLMAEEKRRHLGGQRRLHERLLKKLRRFGR